MSKAKKRIYNSTSRQRSAAQTRERILSSAKKLFQQEGFELATLEKLAESANVSTPTIYAIFQSKRGVLRALMDEALSPKQLEILVERTQQKLPAEERMRLAAKIARQIYDAEKTQMDLLQGATLLSPEFRELEKEREKRRHDRLKETVENLVSQNALASGMDTKKAHDILWAFTGRDLYRMLVIERKWSSDEYEGWLSQALIQTLL